MSERPIPGSARVTRRAVAEIVRAAVLDSYGVTGVSDADLASRVRRWFGLDSGVHVDLRDGIRVELFVTVAYGVPVAEVVRQVESAVRYALRRALGLELASLVVHVGGLTYGRSVASTTAATGPASRAAAGPLLAADAPDATSAPDAGEVPVADAEVAG